MTGTVRAPAGGRIHSPGQGERRHRHGDFQEGPRADGPREIAAPSTPDYVIAELRYDSGVVITPDARFAAPAQAETKAAGLHDTLAAFDVKRVTPHFAMPKTKLAARARARVDARQGERRFRAGRIRADRAPQSEGCGEDRRAARSLEARCGTRTSRRARFPAAMATGASTDSRNFEPAQGYLHVAPDGIDAMAVWPMPGGKGQSVTICDIEGNWNLTHEDLPAGIPLIGGTVIDDLGWRNHGTAVLGEMVSKPGDTGTVGIAHQARAKVHSAIVDGVFNTAAAIAGATAVLNAGDTILIELQADRARTASTWRCSTGTTCTRRSSPRRRRASRWSRPPATATRTSICAIFNGTGLQKDSGAIVVGAGIPPTNYFDDVRGGRRHRLHAHRRAALAHLVLELRPDRERACVGVARDDVRLRRCAGRVERGSLVHAPLLRHVERVADRHRRGRVPAGDREGPPRRAVDAGTRAHRS